MSLPMLDDTAPPAWLRDGGAHWAPGTLQRDAFYASVEGLAAMPGFLHVARAAARAVLDFLADTPMATRVVRDMPMYLLLVCCMHLHHRRDPADPRSGITLARLRQLYSRGGTRSYAADTHLRDMLAWARLRGLLQPAPGVADRRVRRLEPGLPMQTMFQRWLQAFHQAGVVRLPDTLLHDGLPVIDLASEVVSDRVAAYAHDGFTPTERFPQIQQLMQVRHGYHVYLAMVAALPEGDAPSTLPLSVSALATRFEVARGTVRNALVLAQQQGLLLHDSRAGVVHLRPAFMTLTRSWMALELGWMNGVMRGAACRLQQRLAMAPRAAAG
jgi:hypothetical protein